jgi:pyruvate dehydrogenase E1 component beta subunit
VIRMPYGGGVRALEHHSESEEQFYAHVPGLKMVVPSGPRNARALLTAAIRDPDPVVFFEHKGLYHAAKGTCRTRRRRWRSVAPASCARAAS